LGYEVDPGIAQTLDQVVGVPDFIQVILHGLTLVLVLHPICAGLAFLTFLLSLIALILLVFSSRHHSRAHTVGICALISGIITAVLTTVSAIVDIVIVSVARGRIDDVGFELSVDYGNAVWLSLIGAILSWVSVVILSSVICGCCGIRWRPGGFRYVAMPY
jgi:hypothetical protein